MNGHTGESRGPRHIELIVLALAAALQLPILFMGLDVIDTGFGMAFYSNIFTHPAAVQYNFMYWLTGAAGGLWESVFPGVFSLRLLGMLCNLLCIWMLFRLIPSKISVGFGSIMVVLAYYPCVLLFNYDILTATMTVASITLMAASQGRSARVLFFSGLIMGIAAFARVANAAAIFYCLIPLLYGRKGIRLTGTWLAGWLLGIISVILILLLLGQWHIFLANLREVFAIAGSDGASHGLGNICRAYIQAWISIFILALKLGFIWGMLLWAFRRINSSGWQAVVGLVCVSLYCRILSESNLLYVAAAICLIGCGVPVILAVYRREPLYRSLIPAMGLSMMFIMPLGSDGGIGNNGSIALWVAMPAAMACALQTNKTKAWSYAAGAVILVPFALFAFKGLVRGTVYFDSLPAGAPKREAACVPGIYTSPDKARRTEALTDMVKRNVEAGDTLLVYGAAPLLNYLTNTIPAIGSSWPEQYTLQALCGRLQNEKPKHILLLRFDTYSATWAAPSNDYALGLRGINAYHTREKSRMVTEFLHGNSYKAIDSIPDAILYTTSNSQNQHR